MTPPTIPDYADVCAVKSPHHRSTIINRCTHIHHSVEDLLKKQLMTRLICHRVGGCMQRCMGSDALNALFSVTYDCDQACGTEYHARLNKYIEYCQENDLICNCAQTDVKGSRNPKYKRAHMQPDPDQFFHVVETDVDGIGHRRQAPPRASSSAAPRSATPAPPMWTRSSLCPTKFMSPDDS